jgi:hypothetical protein
MKKHLPAAILLSLTLGLAPFVPHPHIWKQLKNLWYGREMPALDWFDLVLHGAPWLFLIYVVVQMARGK